MSIHHLSVSRVLELLHTGETTSAVLADTLRRRIERFNPELNAFAHVDPLGSAKSMSEGPLTGLPISIKDQIHVAGMPCTSGIKALEDFVPTTDAPVVEVLKRAGAYVLGKTAMPPLAMDFQTNDTLWGTTQNPWQSGITAGGSCGGGAAAVASGLSYVDIGADLAGSLRIPAAFCGVCSLMPSAGTLSNKGTMTLVERAGIEMHYLARVGPIARTVKDLQTVWTVFQPKSAKETPQRNPQILVSLEAGQWEVDETIKAAIRTSVDRLVQGGIEVEYAASDAVAWRTGWQAYGYIQGYQVGALMTPVQRWIARLTGQAAAKRAPSFIGAIQRGYRRSGVQFEAALAQRMLLATTVDRLLEDHDAWMLPVTRIPAFPHLSPSYNRGYLRDYNHAFTIGNERVNYFEALTQLTTLFNLTGHPVVTLPVALQPETGLPVGVQLVGKRGGETDLLMVAEAIQDKLGTVRCPMMNW